MLRTEMVGLHLSLTYKCYLLPHPAVNTPCAFCSANIVEEPNMKHLLLLLCLLGPALTIRQDKQINLEDIEHDNLKSEHVAKQEKEETKTITTTSYIQQQQQQLPQPQSPPQFSYVQQAPPQYSYYPVKTAQNYAQQPQTVSPQYYNRLVQRQFELPVVADNSIAPQQNYYSQQPQQQQQYVYLQPYQSAAAAQQVEPRATIQYVMYIPAPVAAAASPGAAYVASPKTESLLQSAQEYLNAIPLPQAYTTQEYAYEVAAPQRYVQQQQQQQQIKYEYVQPSNEPPQVTEPPVEVQPQQKFQYVAAAPVAAPKQPKSLLDSYVPSYLQVQYYKQQQALRNSIQETGKVVSGSVSGKSDIVKSQRGTASSASSYSYQYQVPEY